GGLPCAPVAGSPSPRGAAARHNISNALAAAAAAEALGISAEAIRRALVGFRAGENPARGNLFAVGAARVLLDFGHNPEGVRAVLELARALAAGRLPAVPRPPRAPAAAAL